MPVEKMDIAILDLKNAFLRYPLFHTIKMVFCMEGTFWDKIRLYDKAGSVDL